MSNRPYPPILEVLCKALVASDCDTVTRDRLIKIIDTWEEIQGFKLDESNQDLLHALLELYLLKNQEVSKQVYDKPKGREV